MPATARSRVPILLWALALGATGFASGFFGPIALNPDANQGPLLGIFITGPLGAVGGLLSGVLFRFLPVDDGLRLKALVSACGLLGVGTLYFCLPAPAIHGYVIDAAVAGCERPVQAYGAALSEWQDAVERTTWHTPPAGWQNEARRNAQADDGVVLTLRVARRATVYEHRKPWNAGRRTAGPWLAVDADERYYARDEGSVCATYVARERRLYTPFVAPSPPSAEPRSWPPVHTTSFLRLMELGPVPAEYRALLD